MDLTITVNFPDGTEDNDIETSCAGLTEMPAAIAHALFARDYVTYSSLVIVAVPRSQSAVEGQKAAA